MSDVLYIRPIDPPATTADVQAMAREAGSCFDLHRVDWIQSCLARDGTRMMCWYRAPDAESVRIALRQLGADLAGVHPISILDDRRSEDPGGCFEGFVAEWAPNSTSASTSMADTARGAGSERHPVHLLQAFVSEQTGCVIGVYQAADREALVTCLESVGIPPEALWPCTLIANSPPD
jgi:hypothetical protein